MDIATALRKYFKEDKLKLALIDRHAFACDAGFYYLLPLAIVQPDSVADIQQLFLFAHHHKIPLTFRAGGTSLSGQSISDGILVDISKHWKQVLPLDNGSFIKVQPAVIGAHVNWQLQPYSTKIGPDPASISAAMMGGILSNNSSGMCCGVTYNSYHTLQSIRFVLPNGNEYNTASKDDYIRFQSVDSAIYNGIKSLQKKILDNEPLVQKIKSKYKIKNTVGYSINAFIDYEHPLDILAHLLIGAEGTLAFIAEAVLQTIPDKRYKTTGILFFEDPVAASEAIPALKATHAEALELMDRPALYSIEHLGDCPEMIKSLPEKATAILCEYQATSEEALNSLLANALPVMDALPLIAKLDFTTKYHEQATLWKLRKGMYPSVAAVRAKGTTAMLEDVAVPLENLGKAVTDLQALFVKYGYSNAIIFGHAKEGNLHFLVTQPVNTKEDLSVFEAFNADLAALIIHKYNGSLKAEHGTGRQIAPFVKDEWGEMAYEVMQGLKKLVDPANILNPGVIINHDEKCHVKNIKAMPVVEEEVDKCVECGYCENRCPSRNYTLTPRQRIQVRRSLQRLKTEGNTTQYNTLSKEFTFSGMDTCAVDGMCATDCPVNINTGELIKRLRRENNSVLANNTAMQVAKHFGLIERTVKFALRTGNAVNTIAGSNSMTAITRTIKKILPSFPLWISALTKPVKILPNTIQSADIVYFPSCITRMMGGDKDNKAAINEIIQDLCNKAGLQLFVASQTTGVCCGQLFSSKGFIPAYSHTVNTTIEQLWKWTRQGAVPVLMDVTSCTHSLQGARPYLTDANKLLFDKLIFIDSIDFAADYLLPNLIISNKKQQIVFHPVCSVYKMDLMNKLQAIGKACANVADIPKLSGCCGMAGDRGFYYPELTNSATKEEIGEVSTKQYDGYYSSGKTCEMAMSEYSGKNYQSIFYLLNEVTE
jgi:D-lactate dehydrogenase